VATPQGAKHGVAVVLVGAEELEALLDAATGRATGKGSMDTTTGEPAVTYEASAHRSGGS
jgi:hypothetical protein